MGRRNTKKSQEEFICEMQIINPNIKIVGTYINSHSKIECMCLLDGHYWSASPTNLLSHKGCPVCRNRNNSIKQRKPEKQFLLEMKEKHPELIINTSYINDATKVNCTCKDCLKSFDVTPSQLLRTKGCPRCNMRALPQRQPKSFEDFVRDVKNVNPTVIILGGYTKASDYVDVKCGICGHEWSPIGTSLTGGFGCPKCSCSHAEKIIDKYLQKNLIDFVPQKKFDDLVGVGGGLLSYDFYLPTYNLLIEYQGEYHDGTVPIQTEIKYLKQQEHDKRKREYAQRHNIQLLEIWYWEQDKMIEILNNTLHNPVTTKVI